MLLYETIDLIAGAYTSLLMLGVLLVIIRYLLRRQWSRARYYDLELLFGLLLVYGLIGLDNTFAVWPSLGWDYSTHSAVVWVLVVVLFRVNGRASFVWPLSFFLYALVMLYQQYHTVIDILSTVLVVGGLYSLLLRGYSGRYGLP